MKNILLEIALILLATKLGGLVSRKLKMPEVLGALVAGVIIGPVVFNLVQFNDNIRLLSNLGVIMLMFLAGLETDLDEFKKAGFSAFLIASVGVIVPLILGTLSAYLFFNNFWENVFIGVILTATSVSISVETLTELGKLNTRAGINILGAAVIDDVLGLIIISVLLAISPGSGGSSSGSHSLTFTMISIGLFCVISLLGIAFLPKIINKLTKDLKPSHTMFSFCIVAAMAASFMAESFGIAAITGAYLCGLMLSKFVHKEYVIKNGKAISAGFLSPIFFASVGIEANLKGLNSKVLFITLVIFIAAVIGKVVGCGGAARILKMSRSESVQIGVGMISRGEVAIITANIGLQKGIISNEVFLPTIIVVILTTIITPVLLKLVFSHKNEKKLESQNA